MEPQVIFPEQQQTHYKHTTWNTSKQGKYKKPCSHVWHTLYSFERELKNKLQEKTKGAQSEETVLKKAFKYFDLNDNGTVEPDEFAKAIEKIGIQIPTQRVSISLATSSPLETFAGN